MQLKQQSLQYKIKHVFIEPCGTGEQPSADNTTCELCPLDFYKTDLNASSDWKSKCTPCDDGEKTVNEGANEPSLCIGKCHEQIGT